MSGVAELLNSLDFSEDEISARSKIGVERVKEILRGASITQSELRAISRGLRIPLKSFASGNAVTSRKDELGVLFRDAKVTRNGHYENALETVATFVEAALEVLPKREGIPAWLEAFQPGEETFANAERLAAEFRKEFYSEAINEPILSLPSILVNKLDVIITRLHKSQFEGASVVLDGYCFIFISPRFAGRMLFTLAHELGHLVAHHQENGAAIFDRATEIGNRKRPKKPEAFVDAFASCLLLPASGIGSSLKSIRRLYKIQADQIGDIEILMLARIFGVSFEAAAYRCEQLDLLPRGGAGSLAAYLKKEHGSPEKRADELGLPPRQVATIPTVSANLLKHLNRAIDAGNVSVGWASARLGISIGDLYDWHSKEEEGAVRH